MALRPDARQKHKTTGLFELLEPRVLFSSFSVHQLGSFQGTNGSFPVGAPVMDSSGTLYGVTAAGGSSDINKNAGAVFKLRPHSNKPVIVASFKKTNGQSPLGGLIIDSQGNLFGTTGGNLAGTVDGTVFEIPHGTKTIITLAEFGGVNGSTPRGRLLLDASGNLYGTTSTGGASGDGTVYELPAGASAVTTLATFNGADGSAPFAGLVMDPAGNLFGTTSTGGSGGQGTVFELPKGSSTIATLVSFNGNNGSMPEGELLMDAGGNLFGTTAFGGAGGRGTVFELSSGATLTTLAQFSGGDGSWLQGNLVIDSAGNLIGTTSTGGTGGNGTVFTIPKGGGAIISLASFSSVAGGAANPSGGLLMDSSGNLFGTTRSGGANGDGTVFELINDNSGGTIGQPALAASIVSSTLPATVVPGLAFARGTVTVDLTNQSLKSLKNRIVVNIDAGNTVIAALATTLSLSPQRTVELLVHVPKIPVSLPGGTYALTAQAVDQAGNTSTVGLGPTLQVQTPAVALVASVGNVTPASIAPGKSGSVAVTVTNTGNIDAAGPMVIDLNASPVAGGQTTLLVHALRNVQVNSGRSVIVRFSFTVPLALPTGSYVPEISISDAGAVVSALGQTPFAVG